MKNKILISPGVIPRPLGRSMHLEIPRCSAAGLFIFRFYGCRRSDAMSHKWFCETELV